VAERVVYRPVRRKLPDERRSITHKFSIGGHEGYITVGMYDDGAPGEIFITMANWEPHEPLILRVGYLNNSGNRSGIGLVGRSPWTAADARLLAGRPGGRPLARAPAPHRSTERGLPESSGYPNSPILLEPLPDQLCKARAGADDGLIAFGAGGDTAHFDAGAGLQKGNVLLGLGRQVIVLGDAER